MVTALPSASRVDAQSDGGLSFTSLATRDQRGRGVWGVLCVLFDVKGATAGKEDTKCTCIGLVTAAMARVAGAERRRNSGRQYPG